VICAELGKVFPASKTGFEDEGVNGPTLINPTSPRTPSARCGPDRVKVKGGYASLCCRIESLTLSLRGDFKVQSTTPAASSGVWRHYRI